MKTIRTETGLTLIRGPVLTLGNFDGLHLGHRRIIEKLTNRARRLDAPSVVYTFEPHPLKVVSPENSPPLILDIEDKERLLREMGIDFLVLARFTKEFAGKHPREFVEDVLVRDLSVREVWVGHDFSFGKGRTGTVEYLGELGEELGFSVNVVPAYRLGGAVVSSSRIRMLIREGQVGKAARLLGREYSVKGHVVKGRDIGRSIGFPTANVDVTSELVPGGGVYAARAVVDGEAYNAVVNIGVAPTFGAKDQTVEVHILGFDRTIYRKRVEVAFVRRLRGERAFRNRDELVRRIRKDIERAERIL